MAAPMHDIGKVIIPDEILLKPGKLTDDEFMLMKQHAVYGYDIFKHSSNEILLAVATIAHEHHEKWNGLGYPRGLKGDEISILGRIVAVADVFDALSHDRVYKKHGVSKRQSLF
jgi:HD-GYP domain-containing protein (c-di-GMP phosphodiesterase class II)